ncbi:hypothetical protein SteCoe_33988 [Stentor coeruleus]|uniref:BTB domain-containing protein n=1 Tax=Stentor coeruleus TaxID=5963 RepID=A0A1R2AVG0_9CILI|nr:hypothetical protein SteCoe_33988 [Stentor coeruleus]
MELSPILNIDVGGTRFKVLRETVMKHPDSLLAQVITGRDTYHMLITDGTYFFDRNPQYFSVILDYMRMGKVFLPPTLLKEQLNEELQFWRLSSAISNIAHNASTSISNQPNIGQKTIPTNDLNQQNLGNDFNFEPTLIINETFEPTLIMPEVLEPTLLVDPVYEPTLLVSSPKIEPTLIMEDSPPMETSIEPMKNSIKNFRTFASSQTEVKKEFKKMNLESDDLLSSLAPQPTQTTARTLPWANKDSQPKKPLIKSELTTTISSKIEEMKQKAKAKIAPKAKKPEENEDEIGYESSFIDDDDLSFESSEGAKQKKRKSSTKPKAPVKKGKISNVKKAIIPDMEELSNAIKNRK